MDQIPAATEACLGVEVDVNFFHHDMAVDPIKSFLRLITSAAFIDTNANFFRSIQSERKFFKVLVVRVGVFEDLLDQEWILCDPLHRLQQMGSEIETSDPRISSDPF